MNRKNKNYYSKTLLLATISFLLSGYTNEVSYFKEEESKKNNDYIVITKAKKNINKTSSDFKNNKDFTGNRKINETDYFFIKNDTKEVKKSNALLETLIKDIEKDKEKKLYCDHFFEKYGEKDMQIKYDKIMNGCKVGGNFRSQIGGELICNFTKVLLYSNCFLMSEIMELLDY